MKGLILNKDPFGSLRFKYCFTLKHFYPPHSGSAEAGSSEDSCGDHYVLNRQPQWRSHELARLAGLERLEQSGFDQACDLGWKESPFCCCLNFWVTSSRMKLNVSVYTDCSGQHHGIHRLDNHLLCLDNMCIYTFTTCSNVICTI